jgi:GH15 family glucan-1,4-alpha-glucosidase
MQAAPLKIQNYALIGNGRSAALVGNNGSIDWLCWPRFDSPSIFGSLLDLEKGGFWKISPLQDFSVARNYIEETNVLETHFTSSSGKVVVTDFMTVFSEDEKREAMLPEHELIRMIRCDQGEMEIEINFCPRPDYGRKGLCIKDHGSLGLRVEVGRMLLALHSHLKFKINKEAAVTSLTLKQGEKLGLSLTCSLEAPAVCPPVQEPLFSRKLSKTVTWWQAWAKRATYVGPYREDVIRSALVLKLMGFAPSGAFIAAPTASLPEQVGGSLNWDYRFCWLRDASFTVRALMGLGYKEEAHAFVSWMLHTTRLTLPKLKVVYDVYGNSLPDEWILEHFSGYKGSRPVRIGNASQDQIQLDVYGEVIDGVWHFIKMGGEIDRDTKHMLRRIGDYVCKHWHEKESGIWEEREDLDHYTYSRLLCWVALDRLLKLKEICGLGSERLEKFSKNRDLIKKEIESYAWNEPLQSYTSKLKGKHLDASLLLMLYFEFDSPSSPRMERMYVALSEKLDAAPGLMYRYEKSHHSEGAFLLCSLWKIDFLLRQKRGQEAKQLFSKFLTYANDVRLFAEESEPKTGDALGNFPQAFTHLGIIEVALLFKEKQL